MFSSQGEELKQHEEPKESDQSSQQCRARLNSLLCCCYSIGGGLQLQGQVLMRNRLLALLLPNGLAAILYVRGLCEWSSWIRQSKCRRWLDCQFHVNECSFCIRGPCQSVMCMHAWAGSQATQGFVKHQVIRNETATVWCIPKNDICFFMSGLGMRWITSTHFGFPCRRD